MELKLDTMQLEAAKNMLDAACNHYAQRLKNPKNLIELCEDNLRHQSLVFIFQRIFKQYRAILDSAEKVYTVKIKLTATDALTILGSIVPPLNNTYNETVKQILVDHCVQLLKKDGLIPNNPTFTPSPIAPDQALPFTSQATTWIDYFYFED